LVLVKKHQISLLRFVRPQWHVFSKLLWVATGMGLGRLPVCSAAVHSDTVSVWLFFRMYICFCGLRDTVILAAGSVFHGSSAHQLSSLIFLPHIHLFL
jgi:hypothetical protein